MLLARGRWDIPHLREMAARVQADLLLIYRPTSPQLSEVAVPQEDATRRIAMWKSRCWTRVRVWSFTRRGLARTSPRRSEQDMSFGETIGRPSRKRWGGQWRAGEDVADISMRPSDEGPLLRYSGGGCHLKSGIQISVAPPQPSARRGGECEHCEWPEMPQCAMPAPHQFAVVAATFGSICARQCRRSREAGFAGVQLDAYGAEMRIPICREAGGAKCGSSCQSGPSQPVGLRVDLGPRDSAGFGCRPFAS